MNSVIPDYIVLLLEKPFCRSCEGIPGIQSSSQITASFQSCGLKMLRRKTFNICSTKCIGAFAKGIYFLAEHSLFFSNFSYFLKMIFNLLCKSNRVLFPLKYFYPFLGNENSFPLW